MAVSAVQLLPPLLVALLAVSPALSEGASPPGSCPPESIVQELPLNEGVLVVCAYGEKPSRVGSRTWEIVGAYLYLRLTASQETSTVALGGWSEADSAIRYSVKKTEVVVTDRTWDPRVKHDVPFTRRRFFLTGGKVVPSIEVLLRAPKPNPVRVDQLFRTLALSREELDASYPAQSVWPLESVLYEIRNYGLLDPQGTLIRLRQHDDSWWVDGHIGEELANIEAELELLSRTSSLGHPAAAATTRR